MGQIGQAVARRARGFGMSIHYHNRNHVQEAVENELEATYWDDLSQMLRRMDIVSVNCPFTSTTKNLLSREMLALLPSHAYLVNTSRGGLLIKLLQRCWQWAASRCRFRCMKTSPPYQSLCAISKMFFFFPILALLQLKADMRWVTKSSLIFRHFLMGIPLQIGYCQQCCKHSDAAAVMGLYLCAFAQALQC